MAQRPALSAAEDDAWLQLYTIARTLPALQDQQLRCDVGLRGYDYAILHTLHGATGRSATMSEIGEQTSSSFSRLSHAVTRLEERGLVEREKRGANRHVTLTPAGRRVFLAAAAGQIAQMRRLALDHVAPENLGALADLLRPIADHLRATTPRE